MSPQRSSSMPCLYRIKQQYFQNPRRKRNLRYSDSYLIEISSWAPFSVMLQQIKNQPSKNSVFISKILFLLVAEFGIKALRKRSQKEQLDHSQALLKHPVSCQSLTYSISQILKTQRALQQNQQNLQQVSLCLCYHWG